MFIVKRSTKIKLTAGLLSGLMIGSTMAPMPVQAQQRRRGNQSDSSGFNTIIIKINGRRIVIRFNSFRFFLKISGGRRRGQNLRRSAELTSDNGTRLTSAFNGSLAALPQSDLIHFAAFDGTTEATSAKYASQVELQQLQAAIQVVVQNARKAGDSLSTVATSEKDINSKENLAAVVGTFESTKQLQAALPVLFARVNALPKDGTPEQARALSAMFSTLSDLTTDVQAVADGLKELQK